MLCQPQPTKDPQIVALISAVRRYPTLYDYRLPKYHNQSFNEEVWTKIAAKCNMENGKEAKTLWKQLYQSFTIFYRNELIRLVRANYNEQDIGRLPQELSQPLGDRFSNRSWDYYSDMRFIAPFRIKGTDPELERLIELAKPIVQSDDLKSNKVMKPKCNYVESSEHNIDSITETQGSYDKADSSAYLDIPQLSNLTREELCLSSFFDAMYRSTISLPTHLQRRVKRELLQLVHAAEVEAEQNT